MYPEPGLIKSGSHAVGSAGIKNSLKACPGRRKLRILGFDKQHRFPSRGGDKTVNRSIGAAGPKGPEFDGPREFRRPEVKIPQDGENRENGYQDTEQSVSV
jgi:hypothetical protein